MAPTFDISPLLLLGFEGTDGTDALSRARAHGALGVVLFARNCDSADQVRAMLAEIEGGWAGGGRPLFCIDHEGPRVSRLRGIVSTPPGAGDLGAEDDIEATEAAGARMASDLGGLGLHLDFAPVLDLGEIADHPALQGRCFSPDPERVARHGAALVRGLHRGGITACGKHFPGHGSAPLDSHLALPESPRNLSALRDRDLLPYGAAMAAGLELVMTAHVRFPAIDRWPATCSERLLDGLLRGDLGFRGAVASDDCDMAGFRSIGPLRETAARSVLAGCDLLLCCRSPEVREEVAAGLRDLYGRSSVARGRLEQARSRALALRRSARGRFAAVHPSQKGRL